MSGFMLAIVDAVRFASSTQSVPSVKSMLYCITRSCPPPPEDAGLTVMVVDALAVMPALSVTVILAVNEPDPV
jgi:hypothetical protein